MLVAIPWILAGVGVYTGDVPVLDDVYISKAVVPEPGEPALRAVHLGNHEGIDGILLAATAFALRRSAAADAADGRCGRCSAATWR